jgi:hypothetical protein
MGTQVRRARASEFPYDGGVPGGKFQAPDCEDEAEVSRVRAALLQHGLAPTRIDLVKLHPATALAARPERC